MSSSFTPRRSLARPRPSNGINTASSPNLSASYAGLQVPAALRTPHKTNALPRKASLSALTSGSLATIPDASENYALSTVLNADPRSNRNMAPFTPSRAASGEDLDIGDLVDVPGGFYGTVKFIGSVQGKSGTFAGVELSEDYAKRGKNSGDVNG